MKSAVLKEQKYQFKTKVNMKNIKIIETLTDGTQKELCISDAIISFLRENLKVVIKQDHKFSNVKESNFDVIVMFGEEEISTTDFTVYS